MPRLASLRVTMFDFVVICLFLERMMKQQQSVVVRRCLKVRRWYRRDRTVGYSELAVFSSEHVHNLITSFNSFQSWRSDQTLTHLYTLYTIYSVGLGYRPTYLFQSCLGWSIQLNTWVKLYRHFKCHVLIDRPTEVYRVRAGMINYSQKGCVPGHLITLNFGK